MNYLVFFTLLFITATSASAATSSKPAYSLFCRAQFSLYDEPSVAIDMNSSDWTYNMAEKHWELSITQNFTDLSTHLLAYTNDRGEYMVIANTGSDFSYSETGTLNIRIQKSTLVHEGAQYTVNNIKVTCVQSLSL